MNPLSHQQAATSSQGSVSPLDLEDPATQYTHSSHKFDLLITRCVLAQQRQLSSNANQPQSVPTFLTYPGTRTNPFIIQEVGDIARKRTDFQLTRCREMASTVSPTFTCFSRFPLELQDMVWEEAAADLPVLDIQRFTAEITMADQHTNSAGPQRPLLCFTPHADFIDSTAGHRALLRACRDSREAAQAQIDHLLPIHYLTTDATGSLVARQASVPFNSSGHFCVSGLCLAINEATKGREARCSALPHPHRADHIIQKMQGLGEATASLIENLTISMTPDRVRYKGRWDHDFTDLCELEKVNHVATRMPNLRTASLICESVLNRRHSIDKRDFDRLHPSLPVVPASDRLTVVWHKLWVIWTREQNRSASEVTEEEP